jgi:2-haloacid dehalogenase
VCSWHLKARKPEGDAFERASERFGCAPDRLLLLDDSAANVGGAIRCGWQAERVVGAADVREAVARRLQAM